MKIARDVLERFTDLPSDNRELRLLLDDVGIEVKRVDDTSGPLTFTVELLANRGDHHSYRGVAREITGRTGLPLRDVPVAHLDTTHGAWPVSCHSDKVLGYSATLLVREGEGSFDAETLRPLEAAGIHSISAPVDATNLVNHEIGQPTHVFDADRVDGAIVLRESRPGETAWPLFTEGPLEIPSGTLVVADSSKILAIAGVIGCEDSKATEASTRIVLESATFDPVAVRKASRALDIATDSSARFERGADPELALVGAGRVVHLLETVGWRREGGTSMVGTWRDPRREITITTEATAAFLELPLGTIEIADRLDRYGFTSRLDGSTLHVTVPSWRLWDVEDPADLYEELAKSVGYERIPVSLPPVDMGALPSPAQVARRTVDDVLAGAGFYEVITDGFYGRQVLEALGVDEAHPLFPHVQTLNAVDRAYSYLKNNGLGQAVMAVAANASMRVSDVKIYEWTRTFHPLPGEASRTRAPCTERSLLWGICCGKAHPGSWSDRGGDADGMFLKGLIEELAAELSLDLITAPASDADPVTPLLHPGRRVSLEVDGQRVGLMGEVHPAICKRLKLKKARPWYFEITAEALFEQGPRPPFVDPPGTHPIERTLAFGLPQGVEADSIRAFLHACGPTWLERVSIVDRFDTTDAQGAPLRSITYALRFDNTTQDRSATDVNETVDRLVAAVHDQFGSAGVAQR
ncbi:MAG: phenylalanine--tRNA ligase subunit beta [Alphaproteobacteria bacterium]|nr:phenylalanine--tRNA ligase subunit beta [Alphaproteobacteria bacterium]MCB9694613.1 phenylalanine--tRNA ligase subunit beta [Alphaproteobacteria bacterium]